MSGYLLDNNHVGAAIARVSALRDRLRQSQRSGIRVGTCAPVLCELEAGIQQTGDADSYRRRLKTLLQNVRLWPVELPVAMFYGEIYLRLRRSGRVLSQVDMMLAALARTMDLTILTTDNDFGALPEVRTENWLRG